MKTSVGLMVVVSVVVSLFFLWAVQAEAASIPGLYDTGVDSSNALLPVPSLDPHYTLTQSADPAFPAPRGTIVILPIDSPRVGSPILPIRSGSAFKRNNSRTRQEFMITILRST